MPAGWVIGTPCPECGHSDLLAIGTDHCPVCELLYQATPQWRAREARRQGSVAADDGSRRTISDIRTICNMRHSRTTLDMRSHRPEGDR